MIILNIRQSFRNLRRNKLYSIINLSGLGVSGAFILLIAVYTRHALTMDKFSDNVKKTYRVESTSFWSKADTTKKKLLFDWLAKDASQQYQLTTPWTLADDLRHNYPEIKATCRLITTSPVIIVGNQRFRENKKNAAYVDKNFFSFFDLLLLDVAKENAFHYDNSVVISEQAAKKYFGNSDAVGKILKLGHDGGELFTVSAVAKDFPLNSSMQFDLLFPIESRDDYQEKIKQGVNHASALTLLQFHPNVDITLFRRKLASFGEEYFKSYTDNLKKYNVAAKDQMVNLSIRSFSNAHFNASSPWFYFTNLKSLYQLIALAMIALAIACLNYVLLSLSRVVSRSHETGIRKTIGANYKHILKMLLVETWVLVMLSMTAGFILAFVALPYFNKLAEINISVTELLNWRFIMIAIVLTLLLTFISGIYPAIKMTNIKPLNVLGKFSTYKLNPFLSRIFITFQYTACTVLIAFSIVMAQQIKFVNNKELGFDKEQAFIIDNPYRFNRDKTLMMEEQLRQYASTQPAIAGFTGTDFRYAKISNSNTHNINGKKEPINSMRVDYDYFEFNKIPIVQGRSFSRQFISDTSRLDIPKEQLDTLSRTMASLVVNETLYNMLGKPVLNEVNKPLGGIIIGVCKDYFSKSLEQKIEPAYHSCRPKEVGYFWFRVGRHENIAAVVNNVKQKFNEITNGADFEYNFMDEDIKIVYDSHQRWFKVISSASLMTIFIACLGLFGLSAIVAANRTKEIGIRKVLGAEVIRIYYMLSKQTLIILFVSFGIAIPIAIYVSKSWLENFAYRIDLQGSFFVVAALIGFTCALIAVSYHTLKAANGNPVKSLRTE